ncbi:MAG: hypothetical protein AVO33_01985 [delta proteobacterium ML8_F1]|nr:MAG: hypothetical protein AVO33_01985 [delta proteobacterium ML8_F1]
MSGNNSKGMALPMVIIIMAFLAAISTTMLSISLAEVRFNEHDESSTQAYYIARSVADAVKGAVVRDPDSIIGVAGGPTTATTVNLSGGSAEVYVTTPVPGSTSGTYRYTIVSTGTYRGREATVTIDLERGVEAGETYDVFGNLVSGTESISLQKNFEINLADGVDGVKKYVVDYSDPDNPFFLDDDSNVSYVLYRYDDQIYNEEDFDSGWATYEEIYPPPLPTYVDEDGVTQTGYKEIVPPLLPLVLDGDGNRLDLDIGNTNYTISESGYYGSLDMGPRGKYTFHVNEGEILQVRADEMIFDGEIAVTADTAELGMLHLIVDDYMEMPNANAEVGTDAPNVLIIFTYDEDVSRYGTDQVDLVLKANADTNFFVYGPSIEVEMSSGAEFTGAMVVGEFDGSNNNEITYDPSYDDISYEVVISTGNYYLVPIAYK